MPICAKQGKISSDYDHHRIHNLNKIEKFCTHWFLMEHQACIRNRANNVGNHSNYRCLLHENCCYTNNYPINTHNCNKAFNRALVNIQISV